MGNFKSILFVKINLFNRVNIISLYISNIVNNLLYIYKIIEIV